MQIVSRLSMSADGFVATAAGWPAQLADSAFVSGQSHGIQEFLEGKEAGRPSGTPDDVVTDRDPARLLGQVRSANRGGDVHLIGGPRTIETFRVLGALDKLELVVLPLFLGDGMRLTQSLSSDTGLTLERARPLEGGLVEIVYAVEKDR